MTGKQLKNAILQLAIQGKLVPPACRLAGKTRPTSQLPTEETGVWYVYVIECEDGSFYKGFTTNLQKRYKEHCSGRGAEWTKKHKPKQLYYYEIQYSEEAALKREKYLKSGSGREWFKREVVDKSDDWEPASVLLAKIRKEKEKLVKAGKLKPACRQAGKKDLETTPITDDEKPFEIPESWEWCRLGEIFKINMGQSPTGDAVSTAKNGIEFHQGKIKFGDKYIGVSDFTTTKPNKIAEPLDLLLCVRAPVGEVNITERKICIGRGLCGLTPTGKMPVNFWFYAMKTLIPIFNAKATGSTFVAISNDIIVNQIIPLPPLAEQKRIVAKIEELMAMVEGMK